MLCEFDTYLFSSTFCFFALGCASSLCTWRVRFVWPPYDTACTPTNCIVRYLHGLSQSSHLTTGKSSSLLIYCSLTLGSCCLLYHLLQCCTQHNVSFLAQSWLFRSSSEAGGPKIHSDIRVPCTDIAVMHSLMLQLYMYIHTTYRNVVISFKYMQAWSQAKDHSQL